MDDKSYNKEIMMFSKVTIGLIALGIFSLIGATASAAVHQSHVYTYYSDASKTVAIGQMMTSCGNAGNISDGSSSPYYTISSQTCTEGSGGQRCSFSWNVNASHCNPRPTGEEP